MAEYDLTRKIGPYLDRHLMLPLLDFIQTKNIYPEKDMIESKTALLSKTNMVDYYTEVWKAAKGVAEVPAHMTAKRDEVVESLRKLQEGVKVFTARFTGDEGYEQVRKLQAEGNFNITFLEKEYGITEKTLGSVFDYAKFQFECGNYGTAAEFLYYYRVLSQTREHDTAAMWGKLAAEILMINWETALEDLKILRDSLESSGTLQSRTWFIHWALFVYFNHAEGRDAILDLFFSQSGDKYLSALQTICPHILRYLATAVITNKKKRPQVIKDLVAVIGQERDAYRDPITEFIECLYIDYDFEAAQEKLQQCQLVLENDFFLVACQEEFVENARLMIFENYCRIHSVIDIGMVAKKLGMDRDKAEIWIVNLIRQARLDATIDSQANQVIMDSQSPDIYQHVKEKAKNLTVRTMVLWKQSQHA
eukprot:TRINITY_DN57305_c0_g1_i1.p1 TRINITY_DN57305_c0_g1~~TRINITY_DN57305_c0_g1_i1.p1  ORF type:complete len:443 (-),score=50.13 TRINITY_DN57305_c0_g1_i1:1205-2467(-)